MLRKSILAGLCALALSAFTPACVKPAWAQAPDRVLFQLDWLASGEHAAWYAGLGQGFFRQNGIELSITRGYGSGDTVNRVAAGAAMFGVADLGAVMTARARQNMPVKSLSITYTHSPHSLFVLRSSGITNFRGLEGKRISITPGNSHRLYFPEVARRAGTDPERITWVNTDASAMAAMLITRRVDASPFYSIHWYYTNKAAQRAGEEIVVLPFRADRLCHLCRHADGDRRDHPAQPWLDAALPARGASEPGLEPRQPGAGLPDPCARQPGSGAG